jgi:hypothetical protein
MRIPVTNTHFKLCVKFKVSFIDASGRPTRTQVNILMVEAVWEQRLYLQRKNPSYSFTTNEMLHIVKKIFHRSRQKSTAVR